MQFYRDKYFLSSFTKKDHPYKVKRSLKWGDSIQFSEKKFLACYVCDTWYGNDSFKEYSSTRFACSAIVSILHIKKLGKVTYVLPKFHHKCMEMFKLCPPVN